MPARIQRKRVKDWRMKDGAIYVGRPTVYGNAYRVAEAHNSRAEAVAMYRSYITELLKLQPHMLEPLRGHDLACWCPLDVECRADVLLELANSSHEEARDVRIVDWGAGRRYTQTDVDDAEALGYTDVEARLIAAGMVRQPPTS